MRPRLTFFCELESLPLSDLFIDPTVVDMLQSLEASLSLGIIDFSHERAAVVKKLNQAHIPVTAWLLLPKEQGYWFNLENIETAEKRYEEFRTWTEENELHWDKIGLDIEPDINLINLLMNKKGIGLLFRRLLTKFAKSEAEARYGNLISRIQADGFLVESYQIPFVVDEKRARSDLLKKIFGVVSLPVDHEILMLYSSMLRSKKPGMLLSYAHESSAIAIGSTGGGVVIEGRGELASLSPTEFFRDLQISTEVSREIYIFSLEGCIKQNLLCCIMDFNWDKRVAEYKIEKSRFDFMRLLLRSMLWMLNNLHWIFIIVCLLLIVFLL